MLQKADIFISILLKFFLLVLLLLELIWQQPVKIVVNRICENKPLPDTAVINKVAVVLNTDSVIKAHVDSIKRALPLPTFLLTKGLDISHYQDTLADLLDAADSISFIICKATQGKSMVDRDFKNNWRLLRQKGLIRGAYHFYEPDDDPVMQANFFVKTIGRLKDNDLPPVLDVETISRKSGFKVDKFKFDIMTWLKIVEQQTKRLPVIYVSPAFANEYLHDTLFAHYTLWIADYTKKTIPEIPFAWKKKGWAFWQKSDRIRIKGENSDYDIFNGTADSLLTITH